MAKRSLFFGALIIVLASGFFFVGCDTGGVNSDTFIAVTGITGVPTAAIAGNALPLSGTVEPSNATDKTIVWSGSGVSGGDDKPVQALPAFPQIPGAAGKAPFESPKNSLMRL
jgi:hypothetical protein